MPSIPAWYVKHFKRNDRTRRDEKHSYKNTPHWHDCLIPGGVSVSNDINHCTEPTRRTTNHADVDRWFRRWWQSKNPNEDIFSHVTIWIEPYRWSYVYAPSSLRTPVNEGYCHWTKLFVYIFNKLEIPWRWQITVTWYKTDSVYLP
jgi:hypothetical protein